MSRKTKMTLVVALFVAVLTLAIGYAALSASLNIKGTANVSGEKWEVKFLKDEAEKTPTGKAVCNLGVIEDTSVTKLSAVFKLPGDSCTFTIPVKNTGTLSASLTDVINKDLALSFEGSEDDKIILGSNVEYEVNYGTTLINGSTIFSNIDTLEPGEKETVTLKVTFKSDATSVPKASVEVKGLDRTFVFENRETTSSAATGEADDVNRKPNAPELSSGLIPVYYDQTSTTDGVWKVADKTNSGNNWYDYATQKWANAVTIRDSYYTDSLIMNSSNVNLESNSYTFIPDYYAVGNNSNPLVFSFKTGKDGGTLSFDYEMIDGSSLTIRLNGDTLGYSTSNNTKYHYSGNLSANMSYTFIATFDGGGYSTFKERATITNIKLPNCISDVQYSSSNVMGWTQFESYKSGSSTYGTHVINFKTGNDGGELSFNYIFPNIGTLDITLNGKNIVKVSDSVFTSTNVKETLEKNTSYQIVFVYSVKTDQSVILYNIKLPSNLDGDVIYPHTSGWEKIGNAEAIKYYKNFVASDYEFDSGTGKYKLLNFQNHQYTSSDVGKYICLDGSNSCDGEQLHVIQQVDNGVVKSISLREAHEYKNLRNDYKSLEVGKSIPMEVINTMWVWIPRYSYTIKKETGSTDYFGKGSFGNTTPTRELPGEIDVKFISKNTTDKGKAQYDDSTPTKEWRTNEAFNFGGISRAGIWVGKFETTGSLDKDTQACTNTKCDTSKVTILPNKASIVNQTVSSFFYMARSMQKNNADAFGISATKGDLHMMKNDEWGAVAYLSQSKYGKYGNTMYTGENKEIYPNATDITGSSSGKPYDDYKTGYNYNNMTNLGTGKGLAGPSASTTGTIYGIYDMSGGNNEYVMGVAEYDIQGNNEHSGQLETYESGFIGLNAKGESVGTYQIPEQKYYNRYKNGVIIAREEDKLDWKGQKVDTACNGGVCYGHGLSELKSPNNIDILTTYSGKTLISWYGDAKYLPRSDLPWLLNGHYDVNNIAGIFCTDIATGGAKNYSTTRLSLIP